jgi:gliding motility-associated lipoprotein GldD
MLCWACGDSYTPKPWGYSRIDLPQKGSTQFDSDCPFVFQQPNYSEVIFKYKNNNCWFDLEFKDFNGKVHMSYKTLNNDLNEYTEDSRSLAYKHAQIAEAISEQVFLKDSLNVYGMVYTFQGNTATPMQFYLTDSLNHFVRGALYFNSAQNDSITPISNFVKEDIYRIIESWKWKNL